MQNKVILAVIYVALSLLSAKAFAECEGKLHYLSEFNGSKIYTANTGNAIFDIIYLEENYDQSIEAMKTLKNRYSVVEDGRNRAVIIDFKNNKVKIAWRTTKNYVGILLNAEHAGDLHKIDTCL